MGAVVAIDGPAGSGKSTLARRLALELALPYVNTGLMYRTLALAATERGVDPDDAGALEALARTLRFDLDRSLQPPSLSIDGRAPVAALEGRAVESTVSRVARHPGVRLVLREVQRSLIRGGAVVEGRDIGSVVAPGAKVKLYLRADEGARIDRRSAERGDAAAGVGDALVARDRADAATNPFAPAEGAVTLDTTSLGPDAVFEAAIAIVRDRLERPGPPMQGSPGP